MPRHPLLRRQLRRHVEGTESVPASYAALVEAVDQAYEEFDVDRSMLERA